MSFDQDFENMINRNIRHPEHHRIRREKFHAAYYSLTRERLGLRQTFGLRTAPPQLHL